jgi:hypothetical protein
MNYFAHAYRFLDDPDFAVGTGIPDWLSVVDRKVRVRTRSINAFLDRLDQSTEVDKEDLKASDVARGALRHIRDDAAFHQTRVFTETSTELSRRSQEFLESDPSFRPSFLGHILTELFLDQHLIQRHPDRLERYYDILGSADLELAQQTVNRIAPRSTDRLAMLISGFAHSRILDDYAHDERLLFRLNQVMNRVGLTPLPRTMLDFFSPARDFVFLRVDDLLAEVEEPIENSHVITSESTR